METFAVMAEFEIRVAGFLAEEDLGALDAPSAKRHLS